MYPMLDAAINVIKQADKIPDPSSKTNSWSEKVINRCKSMKWGKLTLILKNKERIVKKSKSKNKNACYQKKIWIAY